MRCGGKVLLRRESAFQQETNKLQESAVLWVVQHDGKATSCEEVRCDGSATSREEVRCGEKVTSCEGVWCGGKVMSCEGV